MLDRDINPDDYPECPECGAELNVEGDKWEGSHTCDTEDCDFEGYHWDNLPSF